MPGVGDEARLRGNEHDLFKGGTLVRISVVVEERVAHATEKA